MHLVDDNELAGLCWKERTRIRELGDISRVFEIKIDGRALVGDLTSKRCLLNLPRAEEDNRRLACERVNNPCLRSSGNQQSTKHPCKLNMKY